MGRAEGVEENAVDEPKLPCGILVDPAIERDADNEAETYGAHHHYYVFNWPAVECLPDMAMAGAASIGMQVLEAVLVFALARDLAQMSCYLVVMVAALVTVAADVRCVRRTAISFVQEVQRFEVPLPLPEALKGNFCLYLSWGVGNTMLHIWWLGSSTLTTVCAIIKHRHITVELVIWCMINLRYVWGFLVFWKVREEDDGVVKTDWFRPRGEKKYSYFNLLGQTMARTEFLHGLSATLGMQTMMLQITPYRRIRVKHNIEVVSEAVQKGNQDKAQVEWGYCLGDFRRLIDHLAMQFAVTHIPKACTVFYQCVRLALSLDHEAPLPEYNQVLSILCAFACFGPTCITIFQVELLYRILVPLCEKEDFKGDDGEDEPRGYLDRQEKSVRQPIWLFRAAYAIACLFHTLAGVQVVLMLLGNRVLLPGLSFLVPNYEGG